MKQVLRLGVLSLLAAIGLFSCEGAKDIQMAQVYQYQDTIPTILSGLASVQAHVKRDFNTEANSLKLIVTAPGLYNAGPEKIQEAAMKAGQMALVVFGNDIHDGTFIVTNDMKDHKEEDPADGIKVDMKLDSLKAASGK
jgi:hypothetical protein